MNKKWYLLGGGLMISVGLMSASAYQSPVKEFQGISYMTADWQEDRQHTKNMLESRQGFNLRLEFMGANKKPLKNVRVRVQDVNNKLIFDKAADKSMLMIRLKPGLYQVEAEHQEQQFVTKVAVPKSRMRYMMFSWKKNTINSDIKGDIRRVSSVDKRADGQALEDASALPSASLTEVTFNNANVEIKTLLTPDDSKRGGIFKREAKRALEANETRPVVKILSKRTLTE